MTTKYYVEKLTLQNLKHFVRQSFESSSDELTRYFCEYLSQDIKRNLTHCFVLLEKETNHIIGFYTLSASSIPHTNLPETLRKKLPKYQIPAAKIGRLAVNTPYLKQGFGNVLMADAIMRIQQSDIGINVIVVDAKNETAKQFYLQYGFQTFLDEPLHLFLPIAPLK